MTTPDAGPEHGPVAAAEPAAAHHAPAPRRWWRRNGVALAVLPLALVAALLASSDRVYSWWWTQGLHRATTADPGQALVFRDVLDDADGAHPFEVTLRLDGLAETTTGWEQDVPLDLPPGTRAVRVDLAFAADPDVPLRVCQLAIRGTDGQRYDYDSQAAGAYQPSSACVPPATPGPWPASDLIDSATDPAEGPRPEQWDVSPVIVLPQDVVPASVLVWWAAPDYAELPVG